MTNTTSNTTNSTRRGAFLSCNAGKTANGTFYAFHMEGNVGREPFYKAAEGEKKSVMSFNMGIGRSAWTLVGKDNMPENPWVSVTVFGEIADALHNAGLCQGAKVVVAGRVSEETYTRQDGTTGTNIRVNADNVYILSNRIHEGGTATNWVTRATRVYESRGETHQEALACLLAGKIVSVGQVNEVNGNPTVSFEIETTRPGQEIEALVKGTYKKGTDYGPYKRIRCTVWGARAQRLGRILVVGNEVVLTGSPFNREWNGKVFTNMSVRDISVMKWVPASADAGNAGTAAPAQAPAAQNPAPATPAQAPATQSAYAEDNGTSNFASFMDEDDDDLPF